MSKIDKKSYDVTGTAVILAFDDPFDALSAEEKMDAFNDSLQVSIESGEFGDLKDIEVDYPNDVIEHNADEITFNFSAKIANLKDDWPQSITNGAVLSIDIPALDVRINRDERQNKNMPTVVDTPEISDEEQAMLTEFEHALVDSISQGMES